MNEYLIWINTYIRVYIMIEYLYTMYSTRTVQTTDYRYVVQVTVSEYASRGIRLDILVC